MVRMLSERKTLAFIVVLAASSLTCAADDERENRGNDPFLHVSSAIADCAAPRGPSETAQEWLDDYRAFWTSAFDRLDEHLIRNPQAPPKSPKEK